MDCRASIASFLWLHVEDLSRSIQVGANAHLGQQGLLFWLFNGGFKVSSGAEWYRSSCGTDIHNSEKESPVEGHSLVYFQPSGCACLLL